MNPNIKTFLFSDDYREIEQCMLNLTTLSLDDKVALLSKSTFFSMVFFHEHINPFNSLTKKEIINYLEGLYGGFSDDLSLSWRNALKLRVTHLVTAI